MMAVKSQTALSTLTQTITYPTTTSTHSVRTHFEGEEALSWTLIYPDCSRFWECGPAYETCLFECAACPCLQFPEQENDPQCNFQCEGKDGWQWANTFDEKWVLISKRIWTSLQECDEFVRFHFWPEGPTCVWPIDYNGTCSNLGPDCDCLPWQVRMKTTPKYVFHPKTF